MDSKLRIFTAGNVFVPAYLALKQKGFTVWEEGTAERETWYAEDATRLFIAEDPLSLLGLVAMHETRGDDWMAEDEEIDAFMAEFGW
ncbi:hypothetical protein EON80_24785 [bacterium]|nr:MAG: hypothetical protein EON80_24785 [bacterium]